MKTWITVAEAAQLIHRPRTTIYDWIAAGRIRHTRGLHGVTLIDAQHLIDTEPTIKRGRRPGSARPATR